MDDGEDNERYPLNSYGYGSSDRQKLPVRNASYTQARGNQYVDDEVEDNDEDKDFGEEEINENMEEEEGNGDGSNGVQCIGHNDNDGGENDEDNEDEADQRRKDYKRRIENIDFERHPKKRKLKNLISNYEFAPRVSQQPTAAPSASKPLIGGGRNPLVDWTELWSEHETFVLLDSWGDRFLQHGRKSLRSEEWQEVAEKVSQESKVERTDTQCRNRLDTLKKKYKKEKLKLTGTGEQTSKWVYFKKMDILMSNNPRQSGLSCGLDSGEYVFMNPRVYLNRANGFDEMRDSPGNSESTEGEADDSDGLPPQKKSVGGRDQDESSFKLLADSIHKFTGIYEKIEKNKRQQMAELEKMRMDFHRDLEIQKQQILERAQAEIAKIQQGDDENDVSAENISG